MPSNSVTRWSNIIMFFATFLIAYGVLLFASLYDQSHHKLHGFAYALIFVGFTGALAAILRNKFLIRLEMILLIYLTFLTFHAVLRRLCEMKHACPEHATTLQATENTIYLEAMPGLYVGVGTQVNYVVTVDPSALKACEAKVRQLWVHSVFLLLTLLLSCLTCCWRFLLAISRDEEHLFSAQYVPITTVSADGDVMYGEAVKFVSMPLLEEDENDTTPNKGTDM